jgi:hypothetical protein
MLMFRPITYNENDFRAYKYTGSATREGRLCYVAASSKLNYVTCTPFTGTLKAFKALAGATLWGTHGPQLNIKMLFPIFRENPDPETVAATIAHDDYVIGFNMASGNEFEVYETALESTTLTSFTIGGAVVLGSTGKFAYRGGTSDGGKLMLGICLGTFGGKYVRIRAI